MQSEAPLTLILSPLRAGRGEPERTCFGSLFGDPDTVPPKVPLSLSKRERVTCLPRRLRRRQRVRVRLDCMDTAWEANKTLRKREDFWNLELGTWNPSLQARCRRC